MANMRMAEAGNDNMISSIGNGAMLSSQINKYDKMMNDLNSK